MDTIPCEVRPHLDNLPATHLVPDLTRCGTPTTRNIPSSSNPKIPLLGDTVEQNSQDRQGLEGAGNKQAVWHRRQLVSGEAPVVGASGEMVQIDGGEAERSSCHPLLSLFLGPSTWESRMGRLNPPSWV